MRERIRSLFEMHCYLTEANFLAGYKRRPKTYRVL